MGNNLLDASPAKLRSDLVVRKQRTPQGTFAIVKDPESGEYFRFGEVEHFIADQLDGRTPLGTIQQRTESRFDAALSDEALLAFVAHVEQSGLLENGTARKSKGAENGRVRGSALYLRVPLVDPSRLLDRLIRPTRVCYTPQFIIGSGLIILTAIATLGSNWGAFTADLSRLYTFSSVPLFILVVFLLVSLHEFAHGVTCRRFGGEVREMGFLLIYFQPALYCNVSDAWLFPERGKRMWVGVAGPYFELFLWALAVLAWRVTDMETWINHLALVVMTGSGVKALFNFNPLIKLDGYYLLSDYLQIPNLRTRSFRYVGDRLKRLFGALDEPVREATPRERRVYLAYGVLATLFSFSLLGFVTLQLGDFLIEQSQPVLLALVLGLVGTRFRHRVRGLMGKATEEDEPPLVSAPAFEEQENGDTARRARRQQRKLRKQRRRLAWLAAFAAVVALPFLVHLELRIAGPATVLPEANADVRAAVEGIVDAVLVNEGDVVKAGDVIARLSPGPLLTDLRSTEAQIREAGAILQKLQAGPTPAEIEVAKAQVSTAKDRTGYTAGRLSRLQELFRQGAATQGELEDGQAVATTAENDLVEAQRRLDVLLIGTRPEEIDATRARIDRLDTERRYLKEQLGRLEVLSPVPGVVATPSRQLRAMERQLVGRGALIAKVYDFQTVTAHIIISEKEIADIRPGQRVELRARAYPNTAFHGTVTAIATAAEGTPGSSNTETPKPSGSIGGGETFVVATRIDNPALLLKPGMTGRAKVFGGQRRIIDLMTRRLARTFKVEVWSWW